MTRKERAAAVVGILNREYGTDLRCYLDHENAWQLLFATILSAQCTDARVNIVTKDLFKKYTSISDFANAELHELEQDIKSTGFYHNKAKNIIGCANALIDRFGGEVPKDIDELVTLPGVGRKTANVIRGDVFGEPCIVVDTHVKRVSGLLGLTKETDPTKIEFDLMKILPKEAWILYNFQIIAHGRSTCIAGRPKCEGCALSEVCADYVRKKRKKV